jgi:RNA polymerase primary sigma factor/RNA polymerase sigma factor
VVEYLRVFRHVGFFCFSLISDRQNHKHERTAMHPECFNPAAKLPASPVDEPLLTVDELARQLRVSTKTVRRWRRYGLVSRRFVLAGRRRVGYLQSSVDRFLAHNEGRLHRGAPFNRIADEGRMGIIDRVRCSPQAGGRLAEIAGRIAQELGGNGATMRHTLKCFDAEDSDPAVFPLRRRPLGMRTKTEIYRQYRGGESVAALAQRFDQSRSRIYRTINDQDAARIMELPLDYIGNEQFVPQCSEAKEREIMMVLPENDPLAKKQRAPAGLPAYLASLYEMRLLTREQESHLFRKMNYLKYKASMLRAQLDSKRPASRLMRQIEKLYGESIAITTEIVCANLRLAVSIAKRYVRPTHDFFELVSDGNVSLLRAVNKFDFSRGNKFSTYATWAIMKNFSRTLHDATRHSERFCTNDTERFSYSEDRRTDQYEQESAQMLRESQVKSILARLDERERQIVTARFGLSGGQKPMTLTEVGATMGVTKERVRQLQARAMSTLKAVAEQSRIECMA